MSRFAEDTSVPADRSRAEIERVLQRYGAESFMYGWDGGRAVIRFRANSRYVQFELPMPDRAGFATTPTGRKRTPNQIDKEYDQGVRQRWRALALVIKAKLEAVASGITTFESEFLAHTVLPSGETVGQWVGPQVDLAYEKGTMPKMLPEVTG